MSLTHNNNKWVLDQMKQQGELLTCIELIVLIAKSHSVIGCCLSLTVITVRELYLAEFNIIFVVNNALNKTRTT